MQCERRTVDHMALDSLKRGPQNLFGAWPTAIGYAQFPGLLIAMALVPSGNWIFAAFILNVVLGLIFLLWIRPRLRTQVRGADGRLCVYCRYSLKDLPSPGICPECGKNFPLDGYASLWKPIRGA